MNTGAEYIDGCLGPSFFLLEVFHRSLTIPVR
jgi:hypothetical protein